MFLHLLDGIEVASCELFLKIVQSFDSQLLLSNCDCVCVTSICRWRHQSIFIQKLLMWLRFSFRFWRSALSRSILTKMGIKGISMAMPFYARLINFCVRTIISLKTFRMVLLIYSLYQISWDLPLLLFAPRPIYSSLLFSLQATLRWLGAFIEIMPLDNMCTALISLTFSLLLRKSSLFANSLP